MNQIAQLPSGIHLKATSPSAWRKVKASDHLVQFYEQDESLIDALAGYVENALGRKHGAVVIASPAHRASLERALGARGVDLSSAQDAGQDVALDAEETLAGFMRDDMPDPARFEKIVGGLIGKVAARHGEVAAFGEMVAILWAQAKPQAAIRLEALWNALAKKHAFSLCCAYPLNGFAHHVHEKAFLEICAAHSHVLPAERDEAPAGTDTSARIIAELQQKTAALEREIADHQRACEALEEAHRQKDEFLATLSHELRNPLAPITTTLQLLKLDHGTDRVKWGMDVLQRQVTQMTRLVNDLLDISRINTNRLELRTERTSLMSIIGIALETATPLLEAKRQRLELAHPPSDVQIDADPVRIAQALANVVNNASKYSDAQSTVNVRVECAPGEAVITVRDSGIGMPAELLPQVFEPFVRGEVAKAKAMGGLGIGLALVKRIVELHGGTVVAASGGAGKGSEFTIRLPALS